MNVSLQALTKACNRLSLPYEVVHHDQFVVRVGEDIHARYYIHWHVPVNRHDIDRILQDKDLHYHLFSRCMPIPKWKKYKDPGYEDPYEKYHRFVQFQDVESITSDIVQTFSLPIILKPAMKSKGISVFLADSGEKVFSSLQTIFDRQTRGYDYLAIAQVPIAIKKEYRVVAYKGTVLLMYHKDISEATFTGNLSPFQYENAKAVHITDRNMLDRFTQFIAPLFVTYPLAYAGFDIAVDYDDALWLIEVNRTPGFSVFVQHNGIEPLIQMHEHMLNDMFFNQER